MQRNVLKLLAAMTSVAVVVSAYAACYSKEWGVVVPAGTTKSFYVSCIYYPTATPTSSSYTMSDLRTGIATTDYGEWDYAGTPPTPGSYWYSATRRLSQLYWYYYDCNGDPQNYPDPLPPTYPAATGEKNCNYP